MAALLFCGCGRVAVEPKAREAGPEEAIQLDWQVLSPRHRGTSSAPVLAFVTPGWLGPVDVEIRTVSRSHVFVTRARSAPWPQGIPPLAIGAWCTVAIGGAHGRAAEAAYVRVAAPSGDFGGDPAAAGFPAAPVLIGRPGASRALMRSGLDPVPESGASATMRRAGE